MTKFRIYLSNYQLGILVITVGLLLGLYVGFTPAKHSIKECGLMGVIMMISLFIGGYILSDKHKVTEGEIRRSITIPILAVFFWLLAYGDGIEVKETKTILNSVLEKYWLITLIVLGFYFGGRSFEKIIEKLPGNRDKKLPKDHDL